jgi:hypothetical protein
MDREGMMAPMGMPTMPMPMTEMHRRMAMALMEHYWHLTHYQSRHFYHYVAQPGDTLNTVAEQFGTSPNMMRHWNCLPPQDKLWPGVLLTIPCEMNMQM